MRRKLAAEAFGTFWLVFGGVGTAVLAGASVGALGIALAFGLTVLTMVYAIGPLSGGHFNPAITVGAAVAGRFPRSNVLPYVAAQLVGAFLGALAVLLVASGARGGYDASVNGLGANGFGLHSPAGYGVGACFLAEAILTFGFVGVVLGATSSRAPAGFAGIAIGLCLTLVHLVDLPITNASVNPARSTGPALFVGGWALAQLWLFWLAPLLGGALAGATVRYFAPMHPAGAHTEGEIIDEEEPLVTPDLPEELPEHEEPRTPMH